MNYFNKIPIINYNGFDVRNLMSRAQLSKQTKESKSIFYQYTIKEEDRVDILSNDYYDDPGYSWLIWMANDVVDPFYDMPLNEQEFVKHIETKYGSIEKAARKISHYRVSWVEDDTILSPSQFDSLGNKKRYYDPIINQYYQISGYKRKKDDSEVNTNQIARIGVSLSTTPFVVGEEVRLNNDPNIYAFVSSVDDSFITVQHTNGFSFVPDEETTPYVLSELTGSVIRGIESGAQSQVLSASIIHQTVAATDSSYWDAVSFLDSEYEKNELKKNIRLIDVRYKNQIENELKRVMNSA